MVGSLLYPLLRRVPEPPADTVELAEGQTLISVSIDRLKDTFAHLRRYRQLLRFLVAFLIYSDGIGTIIGVAAIYGAELGFGAKELILALLLVQFAGIPFALIFGRIPDRTETRRSAFLAFVLFNMVALPLVGVISARGLDDETVGRPGPAFTTQGGFVGEGEYGIDQIELLNLRPSVQRSKDDIGAGARRAYVVYESTGGWLTFAFNGREVEIIYGTGPDGGTHLIRIDGESPLTIDGYNRAERHEERALIDVGEPGEHFVQIFGLRNFDIGRDGETMRIGGFEVLDPTRTSNLATILGLLGLVQVIGLAFAFGPGRRLLAGAVERFDTKRTILLSLLAYVVIAVWGFFLNIVVEFWFLAFMVAIVQGGSQALSRSMYAAMSPTSQSGEFFGVFSIMSKFSALVGPLIFFAAVQIFGSSRPAVLFIVVFFIAGGLLLRSVDVEGGKRIAAAMDAGTLDD